MFTGIIEEIGTVAMIQRGQHSAALKIQAQTVLAGTKTGDSIAVNGVCLTVTELFSDSFKADVMHETLDRSALAKLVCGSRVNLERAMPADGRFGGHIVAGHVDGVGRIARIRRDDTAVWYTVEADSGVLRYVVEKGLSRWTASVSQWQMSLPIIFPSLPYHIQCARQSCTSAGRAIWSMWRQMWLESISRS